MEIGKRICQVLKKLRKRIADANDIPFEMEECTHEGDCPGTCPRCESELHNLMDYIGRREQEGKPIVIKNLMSEEELRHAFGSEHVGREFPEPSEDFVLEGMPCPPENQNILLMGEMVPPSYHVYAFASIIAKELLAKTDGNIIFSPVGLYRMLEMLREGMDYNSAIYEKIGKIIVGFNSDIETFDDEDFKLEHASSIWCNKFLGAIKEDYLKTLEDTYETEVYHGDFSHEAETKQEIDKWVSDNTHSMIKTLDIKISKDALMLVLDAIYMKGKWENPFDPALTETGTFHNSDDSETDVDMMYQYIEEAEYGETDECQIVHLPYRNNEYSMVVILPKEGVTIDSMMGGTDWLDCDTDVCSVDFYMPRFKFDNTQSYDEILSNLGLGDMFEKEDSFPEITDEPVHISQIKQQCVINVEEEGTEAAALTLTEIEAGCMPPDDFPQIVTMRLDRPFGFVIKGKAGQLLFMGIMKKMG